MISYLSPVFSLVALIVASDRDSFDCGNVGVLLHCCRLISLKIPIDVYCESAYVLIQVINISTLQLNFR